LGAFNNSLEHAMPRVKLFLNSSIAFKGTFHFMTHPVYARQ